MKTRQILPVFLGLAAAGAVCGQQFDPGSDASLGDYSTAGEFNSITLPPDGILRVKTFTVRAAEHLRFVANRANTPVYVLATGDIQVHGTIHLEGAGIGSGTISGGTGAPGGFRGGNGLSDGLLPRAGLGPGGGLPASGPADNAATQFFAGSAGFRFHPDDSRGAQNGAAYGSPSLIPLVGGSGGGGAWRSGGGGGGGAILLASATRVVVDGSITCQGGTGPDNNGGSGGAIRLVAPAVLGGGTLDVRGGAGASPGRIRVDAVNAAVGSFNTPGTLPAVGSLMLTGINLPGAPRLTVLQVAGTTVTPDASGAANITLPAGTNPSQTLLVEAANFGRKVPVNVALVPDSGPRVLVPAEIDNTVAGAVRATIPVTFPVNVTTRVSVWTR